MTCSPANSAGIERTPERNFLWVWVTDRKGGESESVTQIRQEFTLSASFPLGLKKEMIFQPAIIISFLDKSILPRAEQKQSHQEHLMTIFGIF